MPENASARLDHPDPGFRLSAGQRASVAPGFDVDALERLLAAVHPELRLPILSDFQPQPPGVFLGPMRFEDPALQGLLDEVWAPRWEGVPDGWLDDPELRRYPGHRIAGQGIEVTPGIKNESPGATLAPGLSLFTRPAAAPPPSRRACRA